MDAISQILRHQDYRIRSESSVAGRTRPTTRIGVDIERGGILYPDVPFFVVQASDGRWLIEQVDLARMTVLREPLGRPGSFVHVAAKRPDGTSPFV
jgi:hypothetical protein